jgi:hypothetical protein
MRGLLGRVVPVAGSLQRTRHRDTHDCSPDRPLGTEDTMTDFGDDTSHSTASTPQRAPRVPGLREC